MENMDFDLYVLAELNYKKKYLNEENIFPAHRTHRAIPFPVM